MPPGAHARLSPSGSKRWMNCPGSVRLSEGREDTTSIYAAEGTAAHELLEWVLQEYHYREAYDRVGETWEVDGFTGEITEEMADAVKVAADYVRQRMAEDPDAELHLERQVTLDKLDPPEGLDGGTADITIWSGPELRDLETIDYKHGQGVFVEVEENTQALYYALATVVTDGRRPNSVKTTIIQPRHHAGDPVRSADYTWEEMVEFKAELFEAAEETQTDDAPLAVGDWCKFCLAQAVCPAQGDKATSMAQAEFDVIVEDPEILTQPELMSEADLGRVLEAAPFVENWINAVRAHVASLIEKGEEVPGWKLVAGRANRRWLDEERAEQYLARKGIKVDDRAPRKFASPAQAEKALKAAGHDTSYIQKFIEQPEGKPKLAPADSPKPALPSSAEADFAEFMEDAPE